jgi:hypothetical protein
VTEPADAPIPYRVVYSERVREELRELVARARASGLGPEVLAAVKEIDRRLRVYPQFGEPLVELTHEPGQVWVGAVGPLVVRYALYEERRLVMVAVPLAPMPGLGL